LPVINIFQEKEPQLLSKKEIATYYFPFEKGVDRSKLEMTDISVYSITLPQEAELISQTIIHLYKTFFPLKTHHQQHNNQQNNITITDATANVGGNTINFSKYFKFVNTIEIDPTTFETLRHNCADIYKRRNISFYLGDCTKVIPPNPEGNVLST
jgi:tRNA G37 N-methylase Trm5